MPYITVPTRREFVAALAGAAGLRAGSKEVRWALLSDTHIPENPKDGYRGFSPQENLARVVPQVLAAAPDGVVIDGDLARLEGRPGDYLKLKQLLRPLTDETTVAMALGNHDHRRNFLTAFRDDPGDRQYVKGKYVLALEAGPVRLLLLDSLIRANTTPGQLGKAQRTWLDVYLGTAPPKPTLVFVHHTLGDGDNDLLDVLWLFRVLRRHPSVKAVIYGHSHVYKFGEFEGIATVNIPAVGYNFADPAPIGWVEATLGAEGADFKLHAIDGNLSSDGKTTSISWRG